MTFLRGLIAVAMSAALVAPALASKGHTPEQIAKDIERHRAMAAAHTAAAQCLEKNGKYPKTSGKAYDDCMKQLQTACKGLGIGKQCGMRHEH